MLSWSPTFVRLSLICQRTAIAAFMLCCAWKPRRRGAKRNPKRAYRVMKVHGLLLQGDGERREERHHDGRIAVDLRSTCWCSDELEITCDIGEKVRVEFAADCCDREAMGHVAARGGITAEDVQDLTVATVEHCYG